MDYFLASQICGVLGITTSVIVAQFPKRWQVILGSLFSRTFWLIHHIFLMNPMLISAEIIGMVRAGMYISPKYRSSVALGVVFAIVYTVIAYLNYASWCDLLVYVGSLIGIVYYATSSDFYFRILHIVVFALNIVHGYLIWTPVGMIANCFYLTSWIVALYRFHYKMKK